MRTAMIAAGAGVAAAVLLAIAGSLLIPAPPPPSPLPSGHELAWLDDYLEPVSEERHGTSGDRAGLPERVVVRGDPFRAGAAGQYASPGPDAGGAVGQVGTQGAGDRPGPRWRLSAIMVTGERRIAIINDQVVRTGERLDDGTRVIEVGAGYVTIITPAGERRRLDLEQ
jgi:hypothetical protein